MRLYLALYLGKIINLVIKLLGSGGGTAGPGYYALKIEPQLVAKLAQKLPLSVVITGTNGKTTTSKMLEHFSQAAGLTVLRNRTGSNLERGIASTLIKATDWGGSVPQIDLAIWEVDEAAFNRVVPILQPQQIVFLNAYRDQLDRYGEVDNVVNNWKRTLDKIAYQPQLVINLDDGHTASLANDKAVGFQAEGYQIVGEIPVETKIKPQLIARQIKSDLTKTTFQLQIDTQKYPISLPLAGAYHVYDFLAAMAVCQVLKLDLKSILASVEHYKPAFGRVEKVMIAGIESRLFLIKNPTGTSLVCQTITQELTDQDLLIVGLNDNFADGLDVSWIWDAQFEQLANKVKFKVICTGTRASDMAVRLKYAGIAVERIQIIEDVTAAIELALKTNPQRLFILPTYTAMLKLQKYLAQKGYKKAYYLEEANV